MNKYPYKMDYLLNSKETTLIVEKYGKEETKRVLTEVLNEVKKEWKKGGKIPFKEEILKKVAKKLEYDFQNPISRVVNGSGVVLHTNLGRATFLKEILLKSADVLPYYVDIEWDRENGKRGKRDKKIEPLLKRLFKTEKDVIVVNNCASALMLVLNTIAKRKEVIVSRGELVEIGGKFRIPEVMLQSLAKLKEVGTTNKTYLSDYENAITEKSGALLKVHKSNFKIVGFTEEVGLKEIVELGKRYKLPVVYDFGTGLIIDEVPLRDEVYLEEVLKVNPDVVTFSGDKLFGGCQAGFIVASKDIAERIRKNNLLRALRVDKFVYFYLSEIAMLYLKRDLHKIPAIQFLLTKPVEIEKRAERIKEKIVSICGDFYMVEISDEEGLVGGGSAPDYKIPSKALKIKPKREKSTNLESFLRLDGEIPIISVLKDDAVYIHIRTLFEEDEEIIIEKLRKFMEKQK